MKSQCKTWTKKILSESCVKFMEKYTYIYTYTIVNRITKLKKIKAFRAL